MNETRVKRLIFRAWRRGFREADLILGPFADSYAAGMDDATLSTFEDLLEESDHDIYAWILGAAPVPEKFDTEIMARLRAFQPVGARPGVND